MEQVKSECYPISILPRLSRLFLDFVERRDALAPFYPASAYSTQWMTSPAVLPPAQRGTLCDLLEQQNRAFGAADPVYENIARLRNGAGAVVTGQQVTLFGGPLFTILKAATVIRKAKDASISGNPQVPIFWLATEDHDLAEADHVTFPNRHELKTLRLAIDHSNGAVGGVTMGKSVEDLLAQASELLGPGPVLDQLAACYRPGQTMGQAFGQWIARTFAAQGLVVVDASSREFHAWEAMFFARRSYALMNCAWHSPIATSSLLLRATTPKCWFHSFRACSFFLIKNPVRGFLSGERPMEAGMPRGSPIPLAELLAILDEEPERLSPNALLRPVFQDSILPTAAYVGGPSEVAYFAQSQVLYERILGRTTPVLPRLSATLIEPAIAGLLARHEVSLPDVIQSALKGPAGVGAAVGRASYFRDRQAQACCRRASFGYRALCTGHLPALPGSRSGPGCGRQQLQDALSDEPDAPAGSKL